MEKSFWERMGIKQTNNQESIPIESDKEREDRLALERLYVIHEEITDQLEHVDEGLAFFEQHEDKFFAIGDLGPILMKYNLLACSPILTDIFKDVPVHGGIEQVTSALKALGQNKVNMRWQKFLSKAYQLTKEAHVSHLTDTTSWILGQEISPYPAPRNPDQPTLDPKFLEKSIPSNLEALALFLINERAGKQIESEYEETWLSNEHEPTEINSEVYQENIEQVFGNTEPDALYELLPKELQGAIAKIELIGPRKSKTIEAHGKDHHIELDGQFDKDEKIMYLMISPEQSIDKILETWFHELGHAMIAGSTDIDRDIRKKFAGAVTESENLMPGYAGNVYDTEGIERGLEEDFAESSRQFFLHPQKFQNLEPQRYNAFLAIMNQHCPSFDQEELEKQLFTFMENVRSRAAA